MENKLYTVTINEVIDNIDYSIINTVKVEMIKKDILFLVLKKKWYKMIESGLKTEEYREIKPYWTKRIASKYYKYVCFSLGYTKKRMIFRINSIKVNTGVPAWGAEPYKNYYCILLGKRII